jgi:hypothetical protein
MGLKIVGGITLLMSFIMFIVGGMAYSTTNVDIGAWWGGILLFTAGALGLAPAIRGMVTAACVLASIGTVVALIGINVDVIGSGVVDALVVCAEDDGKIYGEKNGDSASTAAYCQYYHTNEQCACTQKSSSSCFYYNLEDSAISALMGYSI